MAAAVEKVIKKVKGVLFKHPKKLLKEEKELVNKSFFFEGWNGKAVLLVHGWTSTAYELRRLGTYLNENGYTVSGPMLRGHGTHYRDLENVSWEDWLEDITKKYDSLAERYNKVYVMGTSIGSSLTLMLADKRHNISGLVLMATPYKIKFEKVSVLSARIWSLFGKYNKKFYPPTFGARNTITRLISYQTYPLKSALEVFELIKTSRKLIPFIKMPVFILQSLSDHVVGRHSLRYIYKKIGSKKKKKKYIKRAYHTFISDIKNEGVFEDILKFIDRL